MPLSVTVSSPAETLAFGRALGRALGAGSVVLLTGDLGAGKTVLTRGIAEGAGIGDPSRVVSPTFSIVNVYDGPLPLAHVDLYRLPEGAGLEGIGLEEYLPWEGITVVEWGERLPAPPGGYVVVRIRQRGGDEERVIEVDPAPDGLPWGGLAAGPEEGVRR